jgi:hypothetical protein
VIIWCGHVEVLRAPAKTMAAAAGSMLFWSGDITDSRQRNI